MNDIQVSYYKTKESQDPLEMNLESVLDSFKNGSYKDNILSLRRFILDGDITSYKREKGKLPAVTFCGIFAQGHRIENLSQYNDIVIIDIDHIEKQEFDRVMSCLKADPYVFAVWISPSGEGIKALIRLQYNTDGNRCQYHKIAFRQVVKYYDNEYNIIIDQSGSDLSRLCFVSYDPDMYIKKASRFEVKCDEADLQQIDQKCVNDRLSIAVRNIHDVSKNKLYNPHNRNKNVHRLQLAEIIRYLSRRGLSITSTYEDWYRVAYAIANTFTYDIGSKLYMRLCELDKGRFDRENSEKMLLYCYENSKNQISFATIIYLAKLQGYGSSSQGGGFIRRKCESGVILQATKAR